MFVHNFSTLLKITLPHGKMVSSFKEEKKKSHGKLESQMLSFTLKGTNTKNSIHVFHQKRPKHTTGNQKSQRH